jgi:hypothetical protein
VVAQEELVVMVQMDPSAVWQQVPMAALEVTDLQQVQVQWLLLGDLSVRIRQVELSKIHMHWEL